MLNKATALKLLRKLLKSAGPSGLNSFRAAP